jgi:hypothetical protein
MCNKLREIKLVSFLFTSGSQSLFFTAEIRLWYLFYEIYGGL